ncbi:MAG: recombinase family protein [Euryarchaeota archaeon]|nr:recombinase family protein [Euryarchaeota archaeon]
MGKRKRSAATPDAGEKRVAIYVRVSTEDQAKEGFSLDAQLERLRSYCSARGWVVYREYVDDGYSGRHTNRPAYQRMLREMDNWDVLLVLKMDRIHRNSRNFMEMMELLNRNNKEFVSMTESLDTSTAMGRFVMDIIQRIAQLESEQIGERVYTGMEQKARTPTEQLGGGRHPYLGFAHPYGYSYSGGRLEVVEEEARVVRQIFREYIGGRTLEEICAELNRRRVPTKKGGKWAKYTISRILKNPIYAGYLEWNGIIKKNNHRAIIDKETFNRAQEIIESRGGSPVYLP